MPRLRSPTPDARRGDCEAPCHTECGAPLEVGRWCPTCQQPVDDPDAEDVHVV